MNATIRPEGNASTSIQNLQKALLHALAEAEPTLVADPSGAVLYSNEAAGKRLSAGTLGAFDPAFIEKVTCFGPDATRNHVYCDADNSWYDVVVFDICWDMCESARMYHFHDITLDKALEDMCDNEPLSAELPHVVSAASFSCTMMNLWKECQTAKKPLSIAIFGIDEIEDYGKLYTRDAIEDILSSLSGVLDRCIGRRDDVIGRFGGKCFIAILPFTNAEGANFLAQKVCMAIEEKSLRVKRQNGGEQVLDLSISAGISSAQPSSNQKPGLLIHAAERALKNAAERGKGTVLFESV